MDCQLPSLERLSIISVATTVCKHEEIRKILKSYSPLPKKEYFQTMLQRICDKAVKKVLKLPLPKLLKQETARYVKPIIFQILKWVKYYKDPYLGVHLPNDLIWSPQGTVDERRTAEALIKDKSSDIIKRYKLACINCLEDQIPKLWKEVPNGHKQFFYRETDPKEIKQENLVIFWTFVIKGKGDKWRNMIESRLRQNRTLHQYALLYAILSNNKVATAHFLEKLTTAEKEECLLRFARYAMTSKRPNFRFSYHVLKTYNGGILPLLLLQMNEEQYLEVFGRHFYSVLYCISSYWDWQDFETAKPVMFFLHEYTVLYKYYFFMCRVAKKVSDANKYCYYRNFFIHLWNQTPVCKKKQVISHNIDPLLSILTEVGDKESIKLILEHASNKRRKKIIFSDVICESLISNGKSDLLRFFIQECISSKAVLIKFRNKFVEVRKRCNKCSCSKESLDREKGVRSKLLHSLIKEDRLEEDSNSGDSGPEDIDTDHSVSDWNSELFQLNL